MKVIFDCNIWLSLLINNQISLLECYLKSTKLEVYVSEELLIEIFDVLSRKKIQKYISNEVYTILPILISRHCIMVDLKEKKAGVEIRDPKDLYLITLSEETKSDYLVSGDKDILVLGSFKCTKFITLAEFKELFRDL